MSTDYKLYAIGLKGWVEVRKARTPPRPRITQTEVKGKERKFLDYSEWVEQGRPADGCKLVEKVLTLKVVHFVGGRVLKVVKKRRFSQIVGMSPKVGEMMEIPPELAGMSVLEKVMEGG